MVAAGRISLICVCVLSGAIALSELRHSIAVSSSTVLAERLQAHIAVSDQVVSAVVAGIVARNETCCRRDCLSSDLTVLLSNLDRQDEVVRYEEWAGAISGTGNFLVGAISCSPADGNLWLRMAMVRQASVAVPSEVAQLMTNSEALSPSQVNVLLGRLELWKQMDEHSLTLAKPSLQADLSNLLMYGGTHASVLRAVMRSPFIARIVRQI